MNYVSYKYAVVLRKVENKKLLMAIDSLLNVNDEKLRSFFYNPTISPQKKAEILSSVFSLDERSKMFFELLFVHKRFNLLREIKEIAQDISLHDKGMKKVYVRSALKLDEKDKVAIIEAIKKIRDINPILIVREDPNLIAGIVINFDDLMIDLSARGALTNLESFVYGGM